MKIATELAISRHLGQKTTLIKSNNNGEPLLFEGHLKYIDLEGFFIGNYPVEDGDTIIIHEFLRTKFDPKMCACFFNDGLLDKNCINELDLISRLRKKVKVSTGEDDVVGTLNYRSGIGFFAGDYAIEDGDHICYHSPQYGFCKTRIVKYINNGLHDEIE